MAAKKSSPIVEKIQEHFKGGVREEDLDRVAEKIANELGKTKRVVKAVITRQIKLGKLVKEGNKYVWKG